MQSQLQGLFAELKKQPLLERSREAELWAACKNGCGDSREELITSYQPLVFKTALAFGSGETLTLDLIQEGTVGLIEALERYEPERGVAFSLFALHRIRGRMTDYLKKETGAGQLTLDAPTSEERTWAERLVDDGILPEQAAEAQFLQAEVKKAVARLPVKEQQVLCGLYVDEAPPAELAQTIDVSLTHIYRLQKQGVRRVRGMLSRLIHEMKEW